MGWYYNFESRPTIETDQGIKARSKRGTFVKNWWATRWIEAMEQIMDRGRLSRGRTYARKGQVLSLVEKPGEVEAEVQGSRRRPYSVTIEIEPLTDRQWSRVIETLLARPIFIAQLLAGEMPQEIENVFEEAGVSLFPPSVGELTQSCSCPDWAEVCKHLAATHYILAERFDEDPFLLFRLRGRSQGDLMEALRLHQGERKVEESTAPQYDASPLPSLPAEFWSTDDEPLRFPVQIEPPVVPHPVLVRMGAPAFLEDIDQWLGPAYDAISEAAVSSMLAGDVVESEDESV